MIIKIGRNSAECKKQNLDKETKAWKIKEKRKKKEEEIYQKKGEKYMNKGKRKRRKGIEGKIEIIF